MKLLLVEDEIEIANFLIRGLKYEGYTVEHVADGRSALEEITKHKYDLVILDLLIPSLSGEEVLREVRFGGNETPIIVLTAVQDIETKTKLLNLGADDYLVKPFSFMELAARIKSVARRSQQKEDDEVIEIGELKVIPSQRAVYHGKNRVKLRLKEYDLLEFLARNPNKVISRTTLIEKVWDYNARIRSNTVDSHISLVRKKVNPNSPDFIETIHGVGYILHAD